MRNLLFISTILLLCCFAVAEIDYTDLVNHLADKIKQAPFKGVAYDRLAYITDTYGPRMWGSIALEQVTQEMVTMASVVGFDNVRL